MTPVVVDASAMVAVIFQEPGFEQVVERLEGAAVFAPMLLKYELANVAVTKARRQPRDAPRIIAALAAALDDRSDINWHDVDAADVALIAATAGITAYDASYLWLAGTLGADLVTLDKKLVRAVDSSA